MKRSKTKRKSIDSIESRLASKLHAHDKKHEIVKTEIIEGKPDSPLPNSISDSVKPEKKGFFMRVFGAKPKNSQGPRKTTTAHVEEDMKVMKSKAKTKRFTGSGRFSLRGFLRIIKLQETMELAGLDGDEPKKVIRQLNFLSFFIAAIALAFFLFIAITNATYTTDALLFIILSCIGIFAVSLSFVWIIYLFYLDMVIYRRTKEVEKVFPDFLQLASSNISAGMPIDRALWYAVRPNFGVLSKEIETVAKNTIAGQDLSEALTDFSKKYDSKVIQRSVSLILEGLAAGGELADLLSKIALDIEETRLLKQDMAANVMTYVIFITFASIVAAPALLGLSTQLLEVIGRITASMASQTGGGGSSSFFSFSASGDAISVDNFRIFSYVMLTISSFFAACIVNVIQKGRIKDGLGKIPLFIAVSLVIYFVSSYFMGTMFAGLI